MFLFFGYEHSLLLVPHCPVFINLAEGDTVEPQERGAADLYGTLIFFNYPVDGRIALAGFIDRFDADCSARLCQNVM